MACHRLTSCGNAQDNIKDLKGCFIIEHHPYLPCVPGHGPRWLYQDTADSAVMARAQDPNRKSLGPLGTTLDGSGFFDMLAEAPARACRPAFWPTPVILDYFQNENNGYHVLQHRDAVIFCGCVAYWVVGLRVREEGECVW